MRIISIDISGKVYKYDDALYDEMLKVCSYNDELICCTPYETKSTSKILFNLWNFVPKKKANSQNRFKRLLKALEGLLNYVRLIYFMYKYKPNILHLQWLPFLEICIIEYYFIKLYKSINKKLKLVLTVHNIYPHNISDLNKQIYKKRFIYIDNLLDNYIVHTQSTVLELNKEFGICVGKVNVIRHGVFIPTFIPTRTRDNNGKCRILMYGFQSHYKGTDILVEAINKLPKKEKEMVEIRIVGKTSKDLITLLEKSSEVISWNNSFLSDNDLCQEIVNADLLVFPYRKISQSGALLLGLFFEKPIIASSLPSFVETMCNYPSELFFISENPDSLMNSIIYYLSMQESSKNHLFSKIKEIKNKNSWQMSAKQTLDLYRNLSNTYIHNH